MICTTIQHKTAEEIFAILERPEVEMAEIRLDLCPLDNEEIEELFSTSDKPLVATCRISGTLSATEAEARLTQAIRAGAAFADLEIEAPPMMSKRIRRMAGEYGTSLIRSFHDFEGTDSTAALKALVEKCRHLGAEIVKIVTTAHSDEDCARVLSLYDAFAPETLIAFCMGEKGRETRIDCLRRGAPYSYAALSVEEAAAPGQWPVEEMTARVYGGRHPLDCGLLTMPASKSFAQRAIIAAALADGISTLRGYSPCGDNESAIAAAQAIGAKVIRNGSELEITGIGARANGEFTSSTLHCGESGFLTRMMIPVIAAIAKGPVHFTGEKTLVKRPLKGAREMMEAFGVTLVPERAGDNPTIPLTVHGPLTPKDAEISGKDGSQLVSGLLTALPLLSEDIEISLSSPKSIPYIFITLDVLKKFGVKTECEMEGGDEFAQTQDWTYCDRMTFRIRGGQHYRAATMDIEGDWSSAAAFLVAGAIFGEASLEGLDTRSLQADLSIMDILSQAGASLSQEEETGIIHVCRAPLQAFDIDAGNCPDLFPVMSVLAAFCQGTSHLSGVGRLATKESDRGAAICAMLTQMGVLVRIKGDTMIVQGQSLTRRILSGNMLRGGQYTTNHDHRMAMALAIAQLGADGPVEMDDSACVGKSFPDFFNLFNRFNGQ